MNDLIARLKLEYHRALEVMRENEKTGSDTLSKAYDAGRVEGIKQALEIALDERFRALSREG